MPLSIEGLREVSVKFLQEVGARHPFFDALDGLLQRQFEYISTNAGPTVDLACIVKGIMHHGPGARVLTFSSGELYGAIHLINDSLLSTTGNGDPVEIGFRRLPVPEPKEPATT